MSTPESEPEAKPVAAESASTETPAPAAEAPAAETPAAETPAAEAPAAAASRPAAPPIDERTRKAVLIGLILLAVGGVAYFLRRSTRPRPSASSEGVELRVRGTASRVRLRFTAPGGLVNETVRLPWGYQLPAINGQQALISATAVGGGDVTCEILVTGQMWRTQRATGADATVRCEGVIGTPADVAPAAAPAAATDAAAATPSTDSATP